MIAWVWKCIQSSRYFKVFKRIRIKKNKILIFFNAVFAIFIQNHTIIFFKCLLQWVFCSESNFVMWQYYYDGYSLMCWCLNILYNMYINVWELFLSIHEFENRCIPWECLIYHVLSVDWISYTCAAMTLKKFQTYLHDFRM